MEPIMGNFSGCFVFMFSSFYACFINIRSQFYTNIGNFNISIFIVSRPPIFLCSLSDLVLRLLWIFPHTLEDTALIIRPVIDPRAETS